MNCEEREWVTALERRREEEEAFLLFKKLQF
jgi:hypothetical protein